MPIVMPVLGEPVDELWVVFLDLAEKVRVEWTIVGGQMVLLRALEHDTLPPIVSQDGDLVANIRSTQRALRQVAQRLQDRGFALAGMANDGTAHRYRRQGRSGPRQVVVDVLAPDRVGARTDLTTTPPGHTIEVPAGTQALRRTERVLVEVGGRTG